jgi:hypothetical protein
VVFQVLHPELNKNINQELRPKFPEKSEIDHKAPEILERPGWCSLCHVDCVTKEVLHKSHAFGKKHQTMLNKLEEVSGYGKKSLQLMGWCSLCGVDCKTMEALHREHILTEKHQLMLGIQQKPQIDQHDKAQDMDRSIGKRQQEDRSTSSPKRQKLSVLSVECKICNKEFNNQVVLESHLTGRKHAAQLKKLGNSAAPLKFNKGQSKKCTGVDVQESKNSRLAVLTKDDAESGGKDEEIALDAKDDRELEVKDDRKEKESAEPNEVERRKDNTPPGGGVEEVAATINVEV